MILIYNQSNGEIFNALLDAEKIYFTHSINVPISEYAVDEITDNAELIADLRKFVGRIDNDGLGKYFINNGVLTRRDDWTEKEIILP